MNKFQLITKMKPTGDQPKAIEKLVDGIVNKKYKNQTLLGVTGSGKTFTIANVIQKLQKPTLVIAPNKTLAAQLYNEFKELFPNNAVEYFISYYDYYQPEAYIARTDTYIEKSAMINEQIDRLRHNTTRSLFERNDVIVVASVSCIYGLGLPENYFKGTIGIETNQNFSRDDLLKHLISVQYQRNDLELKGGTFRARGDIVEIMPSYENIVTRISFFGDEIEKIIQIDPLTGEILGAKKYLNIYPAVHYLSYDENVDETIALIRSEMRNRVIELEKDNKLLEARRLEQRTNYDIEMIKEMGYCNGIENYSRIIERRQIGQPPATLIDYFPDDFLLVIDESHVTIGQLKGMYNADQSRKDVLIDYGFRLPCSKDNRPLNFEEFWEKTEHSRIFVSATPSEFELSVSECKPIEQIIRPTGLTDPEIIVKPTQNQIDYLMEEIKKTIDNNFRVLITTLTKRMAEDLTDYLNKFDIKVRYLHSEIDSLERVEILRDLRLGVFDVLVGVNLLREGLDIPEVSLVAIMDADKEGFLRSERSLIQTIGRAARNSSGKVIMFADKTTDSMKVAIDQTNYRRNLQIKYNREHNIIPKTIIKPVENNLLQLLCSYIDTQDLISSELVQLNVDIDDIDKVISKLERSMKEAAKILDFEKAAQIRDELKKLREISKLRNNKQ